jgi:molybdopterin-guanine dinucleotide biosynthesis protein A
MVQQLQSGDFRLVNALRRMNTVYVPAETLPGGETVLANLNTPNEYAALLKKVRGDYSNP